jgi:hypothetical protein
MSPYVPDSADRRHPVCEITERRADFINSPEEKRLRIFIGFKVSICRILHPRRNFIKK